MIFTPILPNFDEILQKYQEWTKVPDFLKIEVGICKDILEQTYIKTVGQILVPKDILSRAESASLACEENLELDNYIWRHLKSIEWKM